MDISATGPNGSEVAGSELATAVQRQSLVMFFAATGGGVQKMRVRIANALSERGISVELVMPEAKGPHLSELRKDVEVFSLETRNPLIVSWRLAAYLRRARPNLMVASQQHTILAALWARWLAGVPVKVVASQHNTLSEICRHSQRWSVRFLLPMMARRFYPWADQIIAVSDGVASDLASVAKVPRENIGIFYNPVVTPDLADRAASSSGHAWLDTKTTPVVLGAGNLIKIKDYAMLVRAFARVRKELTARLVIIGEGQEREALRKLAVELGISADVDLPGFVSNPYAFMARADVFAHPSRLEGLPSAITEALACGCPVVSTNCPSGPEEILQGGEYGKLVPVGDDAALAKAVVATLSEPIDRAKLRRRSAVFSVERAAERYIELLGLMPAKRVST